MVLRNIVQKISTFTLNVLGSRLSSSRTISFCNTYKHIGTAKTFVKQILFKRIFQWGFEHQQRCETMWKSRLITQPLGCQYCLTYWPNTASFHSFVVIFKIQWAILYQNVKRQRVDVVLGRDSNPWPQDGRLGQIHWAMEALMSILLCNHAHSHNGSVGWKAEGFNVKP